jgi:hypothetical protein
MLSVFYRIRSHIWWFDGFAIFFSHWSFSATLKSAISAVTMNCRTSYSKDAPHEKGDLI